MSYEESAQYYDSFDTKGNSAFYVDIASRSEGKVLELGAGTGRVLFEIAALGREVVGIDNSPAMLREAKRKRREDHADICARCRFVLADMLSFDLGERFAFVYAASAAVQTPSADDLRGIFRNAADHLEPGGVFAFDVAAPRTMRRTEAFGPERAELPGGRVVIRFIAQTYRPSTDTVSFDILYKEHIPGRTSTVTVNETGQAAVITPEAIEEAIEYAGLRINEMYGDFDRTPYTGKSPYIVVLAGHGE
ncbi:MAG: methyltransferase domain-containing protein [Candidatus Eisenbacteria bacterium]|nr:methyltransferase domain-containing protein [Candidatus Eisenbacteria bacterium]